MSSKKKGVTFTTVEPGVFEYEQTELPEEERKEKQQSQERKDWFLDMMAVSIGIRTPEKLLDEVSMEGVIKYIAEGKCKQIITMAGAGLSTSAGIPDYRSPGTGLMDQMKARYPSIQNPTDLFSVQFFLRDPRPFFERSKLFFNISHKPTAGHYFIRLLHEKGLLLRHFTQNIDTLERVAGLPADKVVEAHGSYYTSHCMLCDAEYTCPWMEERILKNEVPTCVEKDCYGVIKPDIVMFGESLPERFGELAEEDTLKCDLLIIMGTALAVQPFASLTSKVKSNTPRLYINVDRGTTTKKHPITDIMFGGSFDFDCEDNIRDVFKQGKCDDVCYEIADHLGWGEELRSLVKSEHERIDKEERTKGKINPQPLIDYTETSSSAPPEQSQTPDRIQMPSTSSQVQMSLTSTAARTPRVASTKAKGKPAHDKMTKEPASPQTESLSASSKRPVSNKPVSVRAKQDADSKGETTQRQFSSYCTSPTRQGSRRRSSYKTGGDISGRGSSRSASQRGGGRPRSESTATVSSSTGTGSDVSGCGIATSRRSTTSGARNSLPAVATADKRKPSFTSGNKTKNVAGK